MQKLEEQLKKRREDALKFYPIYVTTQATLS